MPRSLAPHPGDSCPDTAPGPAPHTGYQTTTPANAVLRTPTWATRPNLLPASANHACGRPRREAHDRPSPGGLRPQDAACPTLARRRREHRRWHRRPLAGSAVRRSRRRRRTTTRRDRTRNRSRVPPQVCGLARPSVTEIDVSPRAASDERTTPAVPPLVDHRPATVLRAPVQVKCGLRFGLLWVWRGVGLAAGGGGFGGFGWCGVQARAHRVGWECSPTLARGGST